MTQEHYFSRTPEVRSQPATTRLRVAGQDLQLTTDRGVFAHGAVDAGTLTLLRTIPTPPPRGDLLDLGCGYGPIAISVALRAPAARVWAVDVNQRALQLCRANAAAMGARNLEVCAVADVPAALRFAALYSNPPVRVGKPELHALLGTWLCRLLPAAAAYLVVQRHLGSDTLAAWLAAQGHGVTRLRSSSGYRVLEVRRPPPSPHDGEP